MNSFPKYMDSDEAELVKKEAKLAGLALSRFGGPHRGYCSFYDPKTLKGVAGYFVDYELGWWERTWIRG